MSEGSAIQPRTGCLALAVSAIIMSVPLTLVTGVLNTYPIVLVVTLAIVAVIGTPILHWIAATRVTWLRVAGGGLVTGALVPMLLTLPGPVSDQASVDGVATVVNGSYTGAGWLQTLAFVGSFGVSGIVGALICWALISWSVKGGERRPLYLGVALTLLIALSIGASTIIPQATVDRSCHNPLRGGAQSITPQASFQLDVAMADWPAVRGELEAFAQARGWSIRADVRPEREFPWFQASLCTEPGTEISVMRAYDEEGHLSISVFQPQGGTSWHAPLQTLQKQLETHWPGKVRYRYDDAAGPRPPWAPTSPTPKAKAPPAAPK